MIASFKPSQVAATGANQKVVKCFMVGLDFLNPVSQP